MEKKITSALISVYYKDGLEPLLYELNSQGIILYSTGGTQKFIEETGYEVIPVEDLTSFPSILGGRVKTLHPNVFGGILGRRNNATDVQEMKTFEIPVIDLVIVDLYPFQETVSSTNDESKIIEKIDIGGPSMIRAAAKNFTDVAVIASKNDDEIVFAIIKHTNVCGIASRNSVHESWTKALAGDPESAFGGILICNHEINIVTAEAINGLFFEVLLAPSFSNEALEKLKSKKNRIVLQLKKFPNKESLNKTILNGILEQDKDKGNFDKWEEVG